jgi:CRP-like cAMP-binding protein
LRGHPEFGAGREMRVLEFAAGELLLREGDEQDGMGLLLEGEAVWFARDGQGEERELGRIVPGDFYGEHSLLAGQASQAGLRAAADVRVALFGLEAARKLADGSPGLARRIGETIEQRQRAVQALRRRRGAAGAS